MNFNPLNAELNPICHLLALLGAHHIFHVSGLRVKRWRMWNGGYRDENWSPQRRVTKEEDLLALSIRIKSTLPSTAVRKRAACGKVPQDVLVKETHSWKWVWADSGIILTGENRSAGRKPCPTASFSTSNLTWTDLGSNPGVRGDRPAFKDEGRPELYLKTQFGPRSKRTPSRLYKETNQLILNRKIITFSSINAKQINPLCRQNVEYFSVKPVGAYSTKKKVN